MDERKEDQEAKAFRDDIKYFLSKESFSMHDFHERVMHGLKQKSTFKMMVWGDDAETKVLEEQNKICSAMYDHEKSDTSNLTYESKKEIAEVVQLKLSDIHDVIKKYKQLKDFHGYLKKKKDRKEPIPDTREELMQMYRIEKPKFLFPNQHKKSYTKAQLGYSLRRHYT